MLVGFFIFLRSFGKEEPQKTQTTSEVVKEKEDIKPTPSQETPDKPSKDEVKQSVSDANQVRKQNPVAADPEEAERTRKLLEETSPRKPFSELPPELKPAQQTENNGQVNAPPMSQDNATPPANAADDDNAPPPASEPVREVATNSAEGAALIKDASARVDEAPTELYSDKAKAKVREGLESASKIFKVHTVYFEKGGAKPASTDSTALAESLEESALADAMDDPRAVFFVLGFADKTGDAATNKRLSKERADTVINLLKNAGVLNLTYPVAIGSTELVAPENQNKNRAAEVWLVLP